MKAQQRKTLSERRLEELTDKVNGGAPLSMPERVERQRILFPADSSRVMARCISCGTEVTTSRTVCDFCSKRTR